MVQPQYSPQEALDRIKLMMKYDTSKTLNENVESIQQPVNEIAPLIPLVGAGISWLAGVLGTSTAVAGAVGAGSLAGVGSWIYSVQGGGDAFIKTQTFFQIYVNIKSTIHHIKIQHLYNEFTKKNNRQNHYSETSG